MMERAWCPGRPESTATLSSTSHPQEPKAPVEAQAVRAASTPRQLEYAEPSLSGRRRDRPSKWRQWMRRVLGTTRAGAQNTAMICPRSEQDCPANLHDRVYEPHGAGVGARPGDAD